MLHFDVYEISDQMTDEVLGRVTLALEPESKSSFAYFFRDTQGHYSHLLNVTSMDVQDAVHLEEGKLWQLVEKHLGDTGRSRNYVRLSPIKWADAARIAPNVTVGAWLESNMYYFQED